MVHQGRQRRGAAERRGPGRLLQRVLAVAAAVLCGSGVLVPTAAHATDCTASDWTAATTAFASCTTVTLDGAVTISSSATIPTGKTVASPDTLTVTGTTLTIDSGGTLDLQGTGTLTGTTAAVQNNGTILVGTAGTVDSGVVGDSGHSYYLDRETSCGTSVSPTRMSVYAATVTASGQSLPSATPPTGHTFAGWFTDPRGDRVTNSTDLAGLTSAQGGGWDHLICPHFQTIVVVPTEYSVTFDAAGGTPAPVAQAVDAGATVTEPATAPTKTGYTFAGWFDGDQKWDFANDTVDTDLTLTAHYTPDDNQVGFDPAGGTPVPPAQTVPTGEPATAPASDPAKTGYTFAGWFDGDQKWDFANDTVDTDLTLTAHYTPKTYQVSFNPGSFLWLKGSPTPLPQQVPYSGYAVQPARDPSLPDPVSWATFMGWYHHIDIAALIGGDLSAFFTPAKKWDFASDPVTQPVELDAHYLVFGFRVGPVGVQLVVAGDHLVALLDGFTGDQTLRLFIYSSPAHIGTVHTDANGTGAAVVTLPTGLEGGSHTIVVKDAAGHSLLSLPVTASVVTAADGTQRVVLRRDSSRPALTNPTGSPDSPPLAETGAPPLAETGAPPLAETGVDVETLLGLAILAFALGLGLLIAARRRRGAGPSSTR